MGSCVSVHLLFPNYYHNPNECFICWEEINKTYVKCSVCNITLHHNCALRYIHNLPQLHCPHCQRKKVLYLYINDDCKRLK